VADREAIVMLLELTQRLSQDAPLEEHLGAVTDAALSLLPCDHASIRIVNAAGDELLANARSGVGASTHRARPLKRGHGIGGWVLEHGRPAHVADTRQDPRFVLLADQGFSILSMLAIPLLYGGRTIGIFSASSPDADAFSSDDELLARLLANSSVPAIERARLARLAVTDDLTLAYNARYLAPRVDEELERSRRFAAPLSVAMLDLDRFKQVNDTFGHAVGDAVLRAFSDRVRENTRRIDVLVRRGGEEFVLILPATTTDQATALAERVRSAVGATPIELPGDVRVAQTVSLGVVRWDGSEDGESLVHRADVAMYAAKEAGRNRVVVG
jgi:two-component system cell cycle response regulator